MATSSAGSLRLHLGCGHHKIEGFVNCDLYPTDVTDEIFDVQSKWPFPDHAVSDIYASHMLEHLNDPRAFFREAWRVLRPNGSMLLRMPHGAHRAAWWDLEHVRPWFPESFCFLQPGYNDAIGNPQHDAWRWPFMIASIDVRLAKKLGWWMRGRVRRRIALRYLDWIHEAADELWVYLSALKTPEAINEFHRMRRANSAPMRWAMYQHHLENRDLRDGEPVTLKVLDKHWIKNGDFGR